MVSWFVMWISCERGGLRPPPKQGAFICSVHRFLAGFFVFFFGQLLADFLVNFWLVFLCSFWSTFMAFWSVVLMVNFTITWSPIFLLACYN